MMELLGRMPREVALSGQRSRRFFTKAGYLRRIRGLNHWPLKKVLLEKYRFKSEEAEALNDFLLPMLHWDANKRATAAQSLKHPWLSMDAKYDTKLPKLDD
jgi:serine/threonine-protein kinase SRPK3